MAKFVNLMGSEAITRNTFEAFKVINMGGVENGDDVAITFALDVNTGESAINIVCGSQSEVAKETDKTYEDNDANGEMGVAGYMGSQYLPALSNGLFEQGLDLVDDVDVEPLIWVATEHFSLANNIKNKLMILPLDEGFIVALQEGVIRFPQEDADDLVLARNIGNRDVDNMTFMTSSPGNIQGIPENEAYNQSFLSVTLQRKIEHIITRKSGRHGNEDKGLTTSVIFDRCGTVLLDGGARLKAQLEAKAEEEKARAEQEEARLARAVEVEERQEIHLSNILERGEVSSDARERAATQLAGKGYRNPLAAAFLNAQAAKASN